MSLAAGHLLSWNIEFTNDNGQALWRACGLCVLTSVIVVPGMPLLADSGIFGSGFLSDLFEGSVLPAMALAGVAYVTARLMLIYLTIHSFANLPAGVYDDIDWLQYIPFFH